MDGMLRWGVAGVMVGLGQLWVCTGAVFNSKDQVNGAYEALVKIELLGQAQAADAQLHAIAFRSGASQ